MSEEYIDEKPWVLWRRRLIVTAIILLFLALVWGVQALYENWRLSTGPSAWFMVSTPVTRGQPYAAVESVFGDGYATRGECVKALNELPPLPPGAPIDSCRKLLLSDAARMTNHFEP